MKANTILITLAVVMTGFLVLTLAHGSYALSPAHAQATDAGVTKAPAATTAPAKVAPDPGENPTGFFAEVYRLVTSGQWLALVGALFVGVVWLIGRLVKPKSLAGKWARTFGVTVLAFLGIAWQAPGATALSWPVIGGAIGAGFAAAGAWEGLSDVLAWLRAKVD